MSEIARASQDQIKSTLEVGAQIMMSHGVFIEYRKPDGAAPGMFDGVPVYNYDRAFTFETPAELLFNASIVDAQALSLPDSTDMTAYFSFNPQHHTHYPTPPTSTDWLEGDNLTLCIEGDDAVWEEFGVTLRNNTEKKLYQAEIYWPNGTPPALGEAGYYMTDELCQAFEGLLRVLPRLPNLAQLNQL